MKISFSIFFIVVLSFQLQAQNDDQPKKEWTLQECVQYAMEHNISIQQSELDLKAAEIDKSDALGNYLPSVNANISNNWNSGLTQDVTTGILEQQTTRSFSVGATANIPIFHGLRNLREWQRAKLTKLSSQYSLEEMKDNIMLNIANAYLNVLVNKEQVRILEDQNEVTQEQLNRTKILIEEGASPAGDSLDIKATDAKEKQQIIDARNNVQIGLINLAQILQIDDYKNFDIAEVDYDVPLKTMLGKTPQEIIENAKENRYEIKLAEQDLALAKKDVEIAKSDFYPSLDGFINFNTRESDAKRAMQGGIDPDNPTETIGHVATTGDEVVTPNYMLLEKNPEPFFRQLSQNKGLSFGLQLNIPILNGFSTRNSVKRSKITIERRKNALKQAELDLESNVYQAYVDAQGAAEAYQAAKVAVNAQQNAFDYAKERYDVDVISSFEFSQAKFNLSEAKSDKVNAKFDYIFKLKVLELYFGVSPEDFNL